MVRIYKETKITILQLQLLRNNIDNKMKVHSMPIRYKLLIIPKKIVIHQNFPGGIPIYSSPSIWRGGTIYSSIISSNFFPDACCFIQIILPAI
jgi:hypothetical protein